MSSAAEQLTDKTRHRQGVHELFEAQVARTPDVIACELGGHELTYREINSRANYLAEELRTRGIGPEKIAAIDTGRCPEYVVAVLGVLKAGGAYLPLNPDNPPERFMFIMEDSGAEVLIRTPGRSGEPTVEGCDLVQVDAEAPGWCQANNTPVASNRENLAYVIYTSGSTGRPKGVCMPHGPLLNLIEWQSSHSDAGKSRRTLQYSSLAFDVCFQELLSTLSVGGTLVLTSEDERRDFSVLLKKLSTAGVYRMFLPFVALDHLAQASKLIGLAPAHLKEVITAGEQLRITPAIREFFQRMPGSKLVNQYGPTEAHVVSAYELSGDPEDWPFWPPIGRPIANTSLYILDSHGKSVPSGSAGELFIGGAAVARGYLNRDELTQAKFVPDPFVPGPTNRLYRTGDMAKLLSDGNIEFLGRADDQVKIRGFRVELGEIESLLLEHPGVRECVVAAVETTGQGKILAAYIVRRADTPVTRHELQDYLRKKLPRPMVPAAFVMLSALPVSSNGKVDRQALPTPGAESNVHSAYASPGSELESRLASCWEEVLQCGRVGANDDFFDLGGESLLAAKLVAVINHDLGSHLTVGQFLANPTITKLAAMLASGTPTKTEPNVIALQAGRLAPPLYFVWRNAAWDRLRSDERVEKRHPFFITDAPYSGSLLLAAAQKRYDELPTLEQLAAPHTSLIRRQSGEAPCVVAGFSYGVVLAFEVAHQLQRLGTPVRAVLLFDGNIKPTGWEGIKQRLQESCRRLHPFRSLWARAWRRARRSLPQTHRLALPDPELPSADQLDKATWEERWPYLNRIWARALHLHRPRCLDTRAILFRARDDSTYYTRKQDFDGQLGWKGLFSDGVTLLEIPGDHFTMWDAPNILALRSAVGRSLNDLQPARSTLTLSPASVVTLASTIGSFAELLA
jgi:amino acid adenylation domain-containing protein